MKYTLLFTGPDNKSHFKELDAGIESQQPLGNYSKKFPVKGMMFRDFEKDAVFPMHTAPQKQYIIYLDGEVEVEASDGEKRTFKPGDVLLAADLTGQGHITRTLTNGRSAVITVDESIDEKTPSIRSKI